MNPGAQGRSTTERRPIRRIYVANRGEIAARIATTAARLEIEAVVPRVRGEAGGSGLEVSTGGEPVDLLDPAAIVADALAHGADAVHPGYGFLAESPSLAEAVLAAGLGWIGPPPEAIRLLGDKARSRDAAQAVDVRVADGAAPADQSDASLRAAATQIGLPLLVKPAAGGGGKGIRIVRDQMELGEALATARREAARAFGDDRLILERYVSPARHVEVQVLADRHGAVVHLGDRDCSLQRRHQKILEEALAPGLPATVRAAIRAAAVRLAGAVGYESAGTCEFLVGDDGDWVFLEMNARLQVEHPVTELVLGRDLVADQIRIAEGARLAELGLSPAGIEASLTAGGHAVEVRLNAEDPESGFLPSAGRVVGVRWPVDAVRFEPNAPAGIRLDTALAVGDRVTGAFDPLLAKVIAHGPDRAAALDRLADALDQVEVLGVVTNLALLRRLVRLDVVRAGAARIETLEALAAAGGRGDAGGRGEAGRDLAGDGSIPAVAWQVAGREVAQVGGGAWAGGWRLNGPAVVRLIADGPTGVEENVVAVAASGIGPGIAAETGPGAAAVASLAPEPFAARDGDVVHLAIGGRSVPFRLAAPPDLDRTARGSGAGDSAGRGATDILAPMPGAVVAVHVSPGAAVEPGLPLVTIEAMKMEHVVTADRTGRVAQVTVKPGDQVERGRLLVRLEGAG